MPVHRPKLLHGERSYLTLEFSTIPKALTGVFPTPRLSSRGCPQRPTQLSARSRSRVAPSGASESAKAEGHQPAPRADPPGASVQRDMPARVRPGDARDRVQGDCRRTRAAVWRATAQAAQSAGTRKARKGATDGDTRWRRDQVILARNGRSRCGERPHARMVGRERCGGRKRRAGVLQQRTCSTGLDAQSHSRHPGGTQKGRGRLGSSTPQGTTGT